MNPDPDPDPNPDPRTWWVVVVVLKSRQNTCMLAPAVDMSVHNHDDFKHASIEDKTITKTETRQDQTRHDKIR
jgi:hypothetical protein